MTFASATISNKVQLSPETLGTEEKVDEAERSIEVRGCKGGGRKEKRVERDPNVGTRERETGRDDNLNDRKVGCRNAPKLAITGWKGVGRGVVDRREHGRKGQPRNVYT